jgi:DNA (cytosine-5)-methyltransferase 1
MKRYEDSLYYTGVSPRSQQDGYTVETHSRDHAGTKLEPTASRGGTGLKVAGVFAGIGGLEEGFRQAGCKSTMLCEIDPMARHVLARHFPNTTLENDITTLKALPECDVLTAGFPCQDLSQVGQRRGITGPNSGLVDSVFRLLSSQKKAPTWVVLENVPFMLTLDRGSAIRAVTTALEDLGYNWAYRTINARAFGLPQRRRRVILLASKTEDPRPVLLGVDAGEPDQSTRGSSACGFYWTEGNTGLGWAIDAVPPLKGGSALHIPSPPAIWFPRRRLIATPAIQDAERMQGFSADWTDISDVDPRGERKRWRMVGNAVSVPMAKWIAKRLTAPTKTFDSGEIEGLPTNASWPSAAWGMKGKRARSDVSEWPVKRASQHLAGFLEYDTEPLSTKATSGFLGRLKRSCLRYEKAFAADLAYHIKNVERA